MITGRTRPLLLLALLFTLAASPAAAVPSGERPLLDRVWGLLSALWADVGCSIDPSGGCTTATPPAEVGCSLDPNGGCTGAKAPPAEVGCGLDPSGLCGSAAAPPANVGCSLDPDGRCRQ
ncbi:MAG TPA: hypothetical protein VGS22_01770 [Thermoanaerobaculia bacterium]|jgi:hypothetical protein|nr:hypothetical protein [Thermoanaerobaculia bacterium]